MKLKSEEIEEESVGFDEESIKARISLDNLGYVLDGLVKIYSDPIGSIVRELTSNCYDSHAEAGVDTPIRVGFAQDADYQDYVYFKDQGMGLSHKEMGDIYMEYANSTKRDRNTSSKKVLGSDDIPLHGAFGIGSKSPFAYTDEFYIDSIKDGIQSDYLISRAKDGVPELSRLDEYETDEHNGVTIKIYLKGPFDKAKFEQAFRIQLEYFDNVYFENSKVSNDYNIYEYKTFKIRSDSRQRGNRTNSRTTVSSSGNSWITIDSSTNNSIYIDETTYGINTGTTSSGYVSSNYSSEARICYGRATYPIDFRALGRDTIELPIGIKIPMGEVQPTRSRENIIYDEESVEIINGYIDKVFEELEGIYEKQKRTLYDIFDYTEKSRERGYIEIDEEVKLDVSSYINGYFYKYHLEEALDSRRFNIYQIYSLMFSINYMITGGSRSSKDPFFSKQNKIYRARHDYKNNVIKNKFIGDGTIISKKKDFSAKKFYREVCTYFNLETDSKGTKLHKAGLIYRDLIKQMVNHSTSYEKLVVPEEFINEHKPKRNSLEDGSIIIYSMKSRYKTDWKRNIKLKDLNEFKGLLIYGSSGNEQQLKIAKQMFPKNDMYWLMYTAKKNHKYFEILENCNCIHIEDFMKGKNRAFIRCATAHKIKKMIDTFDNVTYRSDRRFTNSYYENKYDESTFASILGMLNTNIYDHLQNLKQYIRNSYLIDDEDVAEEMLEICEENSFFDLSIMDSYDTVKEYIQGLELLFYTNYNPYSVEHIVLYAKGLGKKLNLCHYKVLSEDYEIEFFRELQEKKRYLKFVESNDSDKTWDKEKQELNQLLKIA